ncbi:D-aminoacyl-tRNA deacylase [Pseudolycoriella hygida]|uniref:D-aminoacyl-tRNA deacylase n=1 Tax=Pseudolycoriella hygida TaxID=35572 RepID=A0A9Q0MRV1_9DIPT|nr:D-aminoacyl-tRNA deacylase [Pseudolycoriella hygida]
MKALIQRVTSAKVTVGDELISIIGRGCCVLIGISQNDTLKDVEYIRARKLLSIRLFDDDVGKRWQHSVKDKNFELLCISQFTLYNRLKGNKPDFHLAMQGTEAFNLYNTLLNKLREQYSEDKIKDGVFGAMMQVHIQNDGPVTIEIESPRSSETVSSKESSTFSIQL